MADETNQAEIDAEWVLEMSRVCCVCDMVYGLHEIGSERCPDEGMTFADSKFTHGGQP